MRRGSDKTCFTLVQRLLLSLVRASVAFLLWEERSLEAREQKNVFYSSSKATAFISEGISTRVRGRDPPQQGGPGNRGAYCTPGTQKLKKQKTTYVRINYNLSSKSQLKSCDTFGTVNIFLR